MFDRGIRTNDASPSTSSSYWGARRLQTEVLISIITRDDAEKIRAGVTSEKPIYFDSDYRSGRWIYFDAVTLDQRVPRHARGPRARALGCHDATPGQPVRP